MPFKNPAQKKLKLFIEQTVKRLEEQERLFWSDPEMKEVFIYITGDKGGGYTKF